MNRLKTSPQAFAGMVEMVIKEALAPKGVLASMDPDPSTIHLKVRLDPRVPGGWAISAVGEASSNNLPDQREIDWLTSGDTGVSSEAIFYVLKGRKGKNIERDFKDHEHDNWPKDASDFGRCFRLLERFPELREQLEVVVKRFPGWGPLVAVWPELEALYREELGNPKGMAPKTYEKMKGLMDACHVAAGWRQTGPGSWHRD